MKKMVGRLSGARFLYKFLGQLYKVMFFYYLFLHSALHDWIMLILVWFERTLHPTQVSWLKVFFEWWNWWCHKRFKGQSVKLVKNFLGKEIPLEPPTITLQLGVQHSETYYNVKIDLNALRMI